jgi:hypothetical protein
MAVTLVSKGHRFLQPYREGGWQIAMCVRLYRVWSIILCIPICTLETYSAYPVLSVCSEDLPLICLGLDGKTESEDIFRKPNANVAGFRSG